MAAATESDSPFAFAPEAVISADASGMIIGCNRAAQTLLGRSESEMVGQPIEAIGLAIPLPYAGSGLTRQVIKGDGTATVAQISTWLQGHGGNEIRHILLRLPSKVPQSLADARLAAIVASSDDAIISKTLESVITSWNDAAQRLFGYSEQEALGKSILMLIPEEYAHEEDMILSRLRVGERIEHYETVRQTKDGRRIEVSLTVSPIRDENGVIVGASKIARDVTDRRAAERALREETQALELINQTGMQLASELDLQVLLQNVTDASTQLTGAQFGAFFYNNVGEQGNDYLLYTLSGAPRSAFENFGHPRATALFGPTFRGEPPIRLHDVLEDPRYGLSAPHFGMPRGHLPVRSYLAIPVVSRSSAVIGGLFFGHPEPGIFTERAERVVVGIAAQAAIAIDNARLYEAMRSASAERENLLESERAARSHAERMSALKDEFLATLSHELRTPLNAILGWAQVLRHSDKGKQDFMQGLDAIERNARVQTQLIEDLLDMSRITSGKVRLDIQPVTPMAFIQAAVDAVRPAADAKGIRLELILDPLAGPVSGDPGRLQQVIWNLLSNAIKFTPRGGKVQVVLERVNSHIEISVADNGAGISPDFVPHVFERFRQGDASTTRSHGGLGLGLSIAKHMIELHGGNIRAKSPGIGMGATFTVLLPVTIVHRQVDERREHPRSANVSSTDYKTVDLTGISVLLLDDEPDARELVARLLRDCGAEVRVAADAYQAIALLRETKPSVLISDIGMPEIDGYEFLWRVRALTEVEGSKVPAVALTAFARSEDRTKALRAGFIAHVAKPVEPSELVATIATVAGHRFN
ncbi:MULTISPECIES: PAS domain S-box protein [Hydrocarboniphaga]|nr:MULTISPECIES: PAS domain S-box protein [Hydrocarboniphaga]MDZ4077400.1 PAS domain S-box protein [Hydrocarboniphaga sp.]